MLGLNGTSSIHIIQNRINELRACKNILITTLITALLCSGLPAFYGEDAGRDNSVDLKDVILLVRVFEGTAENLSDFRESVQNLVSALQVTAGMKTLIKSSDDTRTDSGLTGIDLTFLRSAATLTARVESAFYLNENPIYFESITTTPSSPPPEFS